MKNSSAAKKSAAPQAGSTKPLGVAYLIGRLDHTLNRHLRESLAPIGLTVTQYTALSVLAGQSQLSNAQLAERSFVTPQAANEMVKVMEERGWIDRAADPSHGRVIHLRLTDAGREILDNAHIEVAKLEEEMLSGVAARDRERLQDQLKACANALSV